MTKLEQTIDNQRKARTRGRMTNNDHRCVARFTHAGNDSVKPRSDVILIARRRAVCRSDYDVLTKTLQDMGNTKPGFRPE